MKTRFGWTAVAATLSLGAVLVSQTAWAQGPGQTPGGGQGRRGGGRQGGQMVPMQTALAALNLSDDQKAKIKTITDQYRTDARGLRDLEPDALRAKNREMMQKITSDINAVLTPAQQTQFTEELKKARQAGRQGVRLGGSMGPFGPMLQQLDLTDEQKTKVDPIVKEATDELQKVMSAEPQGPSPEKMEKQKAIVDAAKAKIRPLLTPDQQTKLDNYKERRPRQGGRAGRGPAGGPATTPPPADI